MGDYDGYFAVFRGIGYIKRLKSYKEQCYNQFTESKGENDMSKSITGKNNWALFLLLLAGIVIGGFMGELTKGITGLSWLSYGQSFGLAEPIVLNLGILVITFGLTIKITIASIIGIFIAILIYRFI